MISVFNFVTFLNYFLIIQGSSEYPPPCDNDSYFLSAPTEPHKPPDYSCIRFIRDVEFNISGNNFSLCGQLSYWPMLKIKEKAIALMEWLLKQTPDEEIWFWIRLKRFTGKRDYSDWKWDDTEWWWNVDSRAWPISDHMTKFWAPNEPKKDKKYDCAYAVIRRQEPEERRQFWYSAKCDDVLTKSYFVCDKERNKCHDCAPCIFKPCYTSAGSNLQSICLLGDCKVGHKVKLIICTIITLVLAALK